MKSSISEILWVNKEDFACTRELYEEVFWEDSKSFVDYYYKEKSIASEALLLRDESDNSVISMIHTNPYDVILPIGNTSYSGETACKTVFYFVAAATKKEQRNKGYFRKIINRALLSAYERKHPFTFLMPVSEALYAPYGFNYIYDKVRERINHNIITSDIFTTIKENNKPILLLTKGKKDLWLSALGTEYMAWKKDLGEAAKELSVASSIEESDIGQLVAFAKEELQHSKNVYINRTNAYYLCLQQELQSQGGDIYLLWEDNHLIGYFAYTKESDGLFQEIIIKDSFYYDQIVESGPKTPTIMARIADLSSMGEHICSKEESFCWNIWISDPVIFENNGLFLWTIEKTGSTFLKIDQTESKNLTLDTTIALLTAFCFGYKNPEECFWEVRAYGKAPIENTLQEKLQELKRPNIPFFNEIV